MNRNAGTVKVIGAKQLRKTLKAAGDDMTELKGANRDAAGIAAAAATPLAPRRSGRLRATIRAAGTKTAGIIRAGKKAVPYAAPIHWGWARRNISPTPFLSDGATSSEGQWLPVYEQFMNQQIEKIEGA